MGHMSKRLRLIIVSRFELPRRSKVFLIGGIGDYFCLVYHTMVKTFTIQRATFFNSAVTRSLYFVFIFCLKSSNSLR